MAEVINTAGGVAAVIYERILRIKKADGFETDMGLQPFQGKTKVADEQIKEVGFAISVLEGIDVVQNRAARGRVPLVKLEQRYGLVGYGVCDPSAPNVVAHAMLRDMKRVIWGGDSTFGDRVLAVNYLSRDIGPRADGVNIVMALLEIGVEYTEDLTKP